MKPLSSRKHLLIAESELNRTELVQEWQMMTDEVHSFVRQARTVCSIASAVASLVAGISSLRRKKTELAAEKPSWWQTIFKNAGLLSTIWSAFRPPGCGQPDK